MIKLLIGGSPCTFWSVAQKNGRETKAEGMGWELFKNYLIAKEKFKPDFFLYENNKSAAQAIKDQISHELGVDLMHINSALVSAQNRQRFYAFNWAVDQPEDRGILLRDVLESFADEQAYEMQTVGDGYRNRREDDGKLYRRFETSGQEKANALTTVQTDSMVAQPVAIRCRGRKDENGNGYAKYEARSDNKANALDTNTTNGSMVAEPIRIGDIGSTAQAHRVYSCDGKSVTINAGGGGQGGKTGLYLVPYDVEELSEEYYHGNDDSNVFGKIVCKNTSNNNGQPAQGTRIDKVDGKSVCLDADSRKYVVAETGVKGRCKGTNGKEVPVYEVKGGRITIKGREYPIKLLDGWYIIRKLTPTECERLQTMPDGYTEGVSNAQRYKALGNGWTAEVIIHILNGALKDVPRDEEIVVLSMYDGIGTGRYCLDKMGFTNVKYFAYEIDKYAKEIALSNYPDIIHCGDAFDLRHPDWTIGY